MLRTLQRATAGEGWLGRALPALGPLLRPFVGPWNPWLPEVRRDPYPSYRELLQRDGLVRMPIFRAWVATRFADCEEVLRSPHFSTDRRDLGMMRMLRRAGRGAPDFLNLVDHNLLMIDGPQHTRLRKLVSRAFTPRRVQQLRPNVEKLVNELLDRVEARGDGRMDLVRELAAPLPATVIGELLGVPASDREALQRWSEDLVQLLDPLSGRDGLDPPMRAARALADYFRALLAERRVRPLDDLLSAMITAEEDGERLAEGEVLALCQLLLVAGHETTSSLIGNAVLTLLRHPDERRRLQLEPGLMPTAVEELLRFESPIQLTDRVAVRDCGLGGVRVRRGELVAVLIGCAHRDPARFQDPDRLDLSRPDNRHLAFGHGHHFCLGAQLARLEAGVALGRLLQRFPDLDGPHEPSGWKPSATLRGPTELPLALGPRAA